MVIYFANRKMDILGLASTELMDGFTVSDDLKTEDTDTGVSIFECTIHWTKETEQLAKDCTAAGNYLLRSNDNEAEFYTIIETEIDTKNQTAYIYVEDAGMDLLNETVGAFAADTDHPIAWYVEMYAEDTGFEIGINEISNLSRKLEWTGEATAAERIASVATQFDNAEISYSFDIKGLEITHKYINIHKKRGKDAGVQLRLNREIDRIITTTSVADLATALYVTGGTPDEEEDPITLKGYTYDDGDMYVEDGLLKSREALKIWSRYVWAKEPNQIEGYTGHIVKQWSYDTTSQSELCNRAITQLGKVCEPAVNYEIDIQQLPENVGIGDYVDIIDENGELYLSSRILQLQTSVCDEKQTATLGEFLIQESGISQTVRELAEQFSQLAKSRQFYVWIVYADDQYGNGISLDPEGKAYMGTCTTSAGATPDLSDPSIYKWSLIQGGDGVGIEEIITWYGVSDSPEDVPTEWAQEPYELLRNQYEWSYTETIYTNGVVELTSPHIIAYYDYLEVDELEARVAKIEEAYVTYEEVGTLVADEIEAAIINAGFVTTEYLEAYYIDADTIAATYLTAESGVFVLLQSQVAAIEEAYIDKEYVDELLAAYATIEYLEAYYATIADLNVAFESVELLDADVANIKNVLMGNAGVGDLQSITLTTANAYIEDLLVINALADTILADIINSKIIYTDQITIMSEDGGIYIVGNQMRFTNGQIQFYDDNGVCRLQIGQDGDGNFTFILYDETGTGIMIDSEGIHESAVPDGLIVDAMVAADANIAASKLDIEDLTKTLNENGDLIIDAMQVTIDGNTLDYTITQITERLDEISMEGVESIVNYYAISTNPDWAPPHEAEEGQASILGEMVLGEAILGFSGDEWTTERLVPGEGEYLWYSQLITYVDGSTVWTTPTLITDDYIRSMIVIQQTELEVVQGQIQARIWEADIIEAVTPLGEEIDTISEQYALLTVSLDGIDARLGTLTTTVESNYTELSASVTAITESLGSITLEVQEVYEKTSNALVEGTAYYAVSSTPDWYPSHDTDEWTTEQPEYAEGQYIWLSYLRERVDGTTYWTEPTLLTDETIDQLSERYAEITIELDGIRQEVVNVQAELTDNYSTTTEIMAVIDTAVTDSAATIMQDVSYTYVTMSEAVKDVANYYALSTSSEVAPATGVVVRTYTQTLTADSGRSVYLEIYLDNIEGYTPSISSWSIDNTNVTVVEEPWIDQTNMIDGTIRNSTSVTQTFTITVEVIYSGESVEWLPDYPTVPDGYYLWVCQLITYANNETEWTEPFCVSTDVNLSEYATTVETQAMIEQYAGQTEAYIMSEVSSYYSTKSESVARVVPYYAVTNNPDWYPPHEADGNTSVLGEMVLGSAILGFSGNDWSTTRPTINDGEFLWVCELITYADGSTTWTEPVCVTTDLSDYATLAVTSAMIEQYADDTEGYILQQVNGLFSNYTTTSDMEAIIEERVTAEAAEIYEYVNGTFITDDGLQSAVASIDLNVNDEFASITSEVSGLYTWIGDYYSATSNMEASITQTVSAQLATIKLEVSGGLQAGLASIVMTAGNEELSEAEIDLSNIRQAFAQDSNSAITISAGTITFASGILLISGGNFQLDSSGNITCNGGTLGGWSISSSAIYYGTSSMDSTTRGTFIGSGTSSSSGIRQYYNASRYVNISQGVLTAYGATLSGTITASAGEIGGFTIQSGYLYNQSHSSFGSTADGVYMGTSGISLGANFSVSETGELTATLGKIGGFTLEKDALYSQYIYLGPEGITAGTVFNLDSSGNITTSGSITSDYAGNDLSAVLSEAKLQIQLSGTTIGTFGYIAHNYGTPITTYDMISIYAGSADGITLGVEDSGGAFPLVVATTSRAQTLFGHEVSINRETYIKELTVGTLRSPLTVSATGSASYIYAQYSGSYSVRLHADSGGDIGLYDSGHELWLLSHSASTGYTYIGHGGDSGCILILRGSGVYLNGTSTAVTSDLKFKDDVEPFEPSRESLIDNLIPREYISAFDGETHMGFVAQEVTEAMQNADMDPEEYGLTETFIDDDGEEVGAIRYEEFIPLLVYEIQKLKQEINELKGATT